MYPPWLLSPLGLVWRCPIPQTGLGGRRTPRPSCGFVGVQCPPHLNAGWAEAPESYCFGQCCPFDPDPEGLAEDKRPCSRPGREQESPQRTGWVVRQLLTERWRCRMATPGGQSSEWACAPPDLGPSLQGPCQTRPSPRPPWGPLETHLQHGKHVSLDELPPHTRCPLLWPSHSLEMPRELWREPQLGVLWPQPAVSVSPGPPLVLSTPQITLAWPWGPGSPRLSEPSQGGGK